MKTWVVHAKPDMVPHCPETASVLLPLLLGESTAPSMAGPGCMGKWHPESVFLIWRRAQNTLMLFWRMELGSNGVSYPCSWLFLENSAMHVLL